MQLADASECTGLSRRATIDIRNGTSASTAGRSPRIIAKLDVDAITDGEIGDALDEVALICRQMSGDDNLGCEFVQIAKSREFMDQVIERSKKLISWSRGCQRRRRQCERSKLGGRGVGDGTGIDERTGIGACSTGPGPGAST